MLGGGAVYAAGHLGKNSVGSKQLKKNAITTAKIKNEAVTGAKVKKRTLTGAQIDASTLGTVPMANQAKSLAPPEGWHIVGAPGEPVLAIPGIRLAGATSLRSTRTRRASFTSKAWS